MPGRYLSFPGGGKGRTEYAERDDKWRLRRLDEVPEWMGHNRFILSGYRLGYTISMCLRSVFMVHNETGNVWTHLIGFLFFVGLAAHVLANVIEPRATHVLVFLAYAVANLICMGSSAAYHLFGCHSEGIMMAMVRVDYFGISALITSSFLPLLVFAFSCFPHLQILYVSQLAVLGGATLVAPLFNKFNSDEWHRPRTALFVATAASGMIPVVHSLFLFPSNSITAPVHHGIALMFLFYGLGTFVYVTKLPESAFPGRFDLWFNSHQVWHILVLLAAAVHFFTCIGIYQRWAPSQC